MTSQTADGGARKSARGRGQSGTRPLDPDPTRQERPRRPEAGGDQIRRRSPLPRRRRERGLAAGRYGPRREAPQERGRSGGCRLPESRTDLRRGGPEQRLGEGAPAAKSRAILAVGRSEERRVGKECRL